MSWLDLPAATGFGLDNLPYGVFSTGDGQRRTGIAVGDAVLDLAGLTGAPVHRTGSLNAFLALRPPVWRQLREQRAEWLTDAAHRSAVEPRLRRRDQVPLLLLSEVADYVDFYSAQHHAENPGRMFRPN